MLRFPFWIVTQHRGLISKPVEPPGMLGFIAAFSSAERATAFMVSRGETVWENRLVSRSSLQEWLTDLRRLGAKGLCLDPCRENGGTPIPFDELGLG